ncbi:SAM-dependent methyltransferase [Streptomyces sp. H39-S7]|uniref:SAM-dependent methyltransferase n=1 Tax=Streptomyces sp. H39-S7 TaxID=3004357 RepID=UPI0022AF1EF5|nr:class I SAM-dependent methyltransferase [Streptomyces sp. H39-S7]MCZ4125550.1 class I SAM-dependent methyltransferase [Streptomyces sp. H39-S7]
MDRQRISAIAHADHPIAAPLSDDSVHTLLDRALPRGEARLLDLGCGSGTWLVRAQTARPGLRAEGVDNAGETIAAARRTIAEAGLGDRIVLHDQDAEGFTSPHRYDLVLSIGATHAFGGLLPTLEAARRHLAPGGSILLGACFWEREPGRTTFDSGFTADDYDDLATTVDRIVADGWTPLHGHVSTLQEWDAYEWSWTGTLSRWALDHPEHPDSGEALRAAAEHRETWLHGYRGTLGFVTLLLRRTIQP